jgi:heat shock protein HtpX
MMTRLMNNLKTTMLLAVMMGLFIAIGRYFGGQHGMMMGFLFGGAMNLVAYFFSDKIALMSMRAQPVTPEQAPELYRIVADLATKANLPMPRVYIAPMDAPNAFATGRNPKNSVVCVTEGLMRLMDRRQLAAVVAHELGHIHNRDILISSIAATIAGAISMLAHMGIFFGGRDDREGHPLAGLLMILLAPLAAAVIQAMISRKREFGADAFSAELMNDPIPLATALQKLEAGVEQHPMELSNPSQANMFIVEPFIGRGLVNLFATHPPVKARVEALMKHTQRMGPVSR